MYTAWREEEVNSVHVQIHSSIDIRSNPKLACLARRQRRSWVVWQGRECWARLPTDTRTERRMRSFSNPICSWIWGLFYRWKKQMLVQLEVLVCQLLSFRKVAIHNISQTERTRIACLHVAGLRHVQLVHPVHHENNFQVWPKQSICIFSMLLPQFLS